MFPTAEQTGTTSPPESSGGGMPPPAAPGSEPPKRQRRGRPLGSRSAAPMPPEQAVPGDAPQVEQPTQRRRRKAAIDKESLAKQLQGLHMMAATITQLPFVQINEQEAAMLADAIENVSREYDLALDGKTGAFIQLAAVAAIVYGPRLVHYQKLKKQAQREEPVTVDGTATVNGAAAASPGH